MSFSLGGCSNLLLPWMSFFIAGSYHTVRGRRRWFMCAWTAAARVVGLWLMWTVRVRRCHDGGGDSGVVGRTWRVPPPVRVMQSQEPW